MNDSIRAKNGMVEVDVVPAAPFPTPQEFYVNLPLYKEVEVQSEHATLAHELRFKDKSIDVYCQDCGQHSIFRQTNIASDSWFHGWADFGGYETTFSCSRDGQHVIRFIVRAVEDKLMKIGQYPSLATLATYDVKKYKKVLDQTYFQELTKAIGLAAHGIGVGSFVYLRRIFESLIEKAHESMKAAEGWNEDTYTKARMDGKIELLKSKLPEFLVEHKHMYGILSKGVHELSEEECLEYFSVVKMGIEFILDEEIVRMEKMKKAEEVKRSLAGIQSKLKK